MSDPWNIMELVTLSTVLVVITTRVVTIFKPTHGTEQLHRRSYTAFLILTWLHFMKSCRPFTALGPFIALLGNVVGVTIQFAFLFIMFFLPYTVGFWILF